MDKLINDLNREIEILNERRKHAVAHAISRLTNDVRSRHLGHNLGSDADEISSLDAKIEQTERILSALQQAAAEAK